MNGLPDPAPLDRKSFSEALLLILEELRSMKAGAQLSVTGLAEKLAIDRRIVDRALRVLVDIQNVLAVKELVRMKVGRSLVLRVLDRSRQARSAIGRFQRRLKIRGV